jgi:hypothetical protein
MSVAAIDYRQFIEPVVEYRIYNPSLTPIEAMHNGRVYRVPGREQFYFDPITRRNYDEPGVLPIRGYVDKVRVGREIEDRPITAREIVVHLTGEDGVTGKLGVSGVRLLPPPEDERAEMVRQEALAANEAKTYADAGYTITAFEAMNAKRIEAKQPPLPPNKRQEEAYAYRAMVDAKGSVKHEAFTCPRCFKGLQTAQATRDHINELHAPWADSLIKTAGVAENEITDTPKRGPGRPRKDATATA